MSKTHLLSLKFSQTNGGVQGKDKKCDTKGISSGGFESKHSIQMGYLRRLLRGGVSEFHTEASLICQKGNGNGGEPSRLRKQHAPRAKKWKRLECVPKTQGEPWAGTNSEK